MTRIGRIGVVTALGLLSAVLLVPFSFADQAAWRNYQKTRDAQSGSVIAESNVAVEGWLVRSRSLDHVDLGFPLLKAQYVRRSILPAPELLKDGEDIYKSPRFGLRLREDGMDMAFIGLPYEKDRVEFGPQSKVKVWVDLYFNRKLVARTAEMTTRPVGFFLPIVDYAGKTQEDFIEVMKTAWQWKALVYFDGENGYTYTGPMKHAGIAYEAAMDELRFRLQKKAQGLTANGAEGRDATLPF